MYFRNKYDKGIFKRSREFTILKKVMGCKEKLLSNGIPIKYKDIRIETITPIRFILINIIQSSLYLKTRYIYPQLSGRTKR